MESFLQLFEQVKNSQEELHNFAVQFGGPTWIRTKNQQIVHRRLKTVDSSDFRTPILVTSGQI
jgi:hypothetical protein